VDDEFWAGIDDIEIGKGNPPLSIIARNDDGSVHKAFFDTVKRRNLRLPNESDEDLIVRFENLIRKKYQGDLLGSFFNSGRKKRP